MRGTNLSTQTRKRVDASSMLSDERVFSTGGVPVEGLSLEHRSLLMSFWFDLSLSFSRGGRRFGSLLGDFSKALGYFRFCARLGLLFF